MPYKIEYDPGTKCVYASMEGEVNREVMENFITEMSSALRDNHCRRLLNDMRNMSNKSSLTDVFDLPKVVAKKGYAHKTRRALVYSTDEELFRFFEATSRNRGQNVRVFDDYETAKRWVLSNED